jgi:hypothetical protein
MDLLKCWRDTRYNNLKLLFNRQTNQLYEAIKERDMWEQRYIAAAKDADYFANILIGTWEPE